ncbi:MAG: hypothetical protein ACREGK_06340, partial [Geminicoccales bacterium]
PYALAACAVLAAGCAMPTAPSGAAPARIEFFRGNPVFCGQSGSPICEARVNHAEGKPVHALTPYVDIAPGDHVLGLFCRANLAIMLGDAQGFQREVEIALAPGGRYRLEASMEPRPCTMQLIDEATGKPVGKVR